MTSVTPVEYACQFTQLGPGSNLVDNAPGGGQVILGRDAPAQIGASEQGYATRVKVTRCSYGSVGSADIETTIKDQPFDDFLSACRKSLIGVQVSVTADTSTLKSPGSMQTVKLFDGYVDQPSYHLAADELSIPCRDQSALLMETDVQARSYKDEVIYQVVEDLLGQAGYNSDQQLSLVSTTGPAALRYGTFLKNSRSVTSHKTSAWKLIQRMADAIGYVAYATPDDRFYFGPRVRADAPPLTLVWGGQGQQGDLLGDPEIVHTPARSGAFFVSVASHDPNTGAQIQHTVTYANPQWVANGGSGGPTGQFITGLSVEQAQSQYGQIQSYDFYAEGLTPDAAAAKAMAHALDIQAHELIVKCSILGNPSVLIGQPVTFVNTGFPTIDQTTFFLAGITDDLEVAQSGSKARGYVTSLVAWQSLGGM
jgi:hypothetical protein